MWKVDPNTIITAEQKRDQQVETYRVAIQRHIDEIAQSRNYNDGNSVASYKDSTVTQWASEATAFIAWRDGVWLYVYDELDKVNSGLRDAPSVDEFIAELPVIDWNS